MDVLAVLGEGEIALDEVLELDVEIESPGFPFAKKLSLDGKPSGASSGAVFHDNLDEVVGDHVEKPRMNDAVHASPISTTRR